MGFTPSKTDSDLWYKDEGAHYVYIVTYVDDLLIWAHDPMYYMNIFMEDFELKGVGIPEYYLGGDVEFLDEHWTNENIGMAFSSKTYISNLIPNFEKLFNMNFKSIKTPMAADYHPEVDDTPLLSDDDASKYRSIIGSMNWLITLGRFDILYDTNTLSRIAMAPREGHLRAAFRILSYIKTFPKGRIIFDTSYPTKIESDEPNWKEFYPDAVEELPYNMLKPRGKPVRIIIYVDADHAHDVVTRRSVTGILVFLNNTPVRWICKRRNTVETSTYGSELVAARVATELVMQIRYQLRMLGVPIDGPATMFIDNNSVVLNCSTSSSILKKKHLSLAYNRVCEACAVKILNIHYVKSSSYYADVLTKPLGGPEFYSLVKPHLFRAPKWNV